MSTVSYAHPLARPRWAQVTIGDALFVVVGALAAVLRLRLLGSVPLSPAEAETALGVWQLWTPGGAAQLLSSPAYAALTSLLTLAAGFSDTMVRLAPALLGVGLALLPWLLRRQLGAVGALAAGLLLAVSPLATIAARTAGGDGVALFALLLLAIGGLRQTAEEDARWRFVTAAALALGLTSAPLFVGGLITLLLAGWLDQRLARDDSLPASPASGAAPAESERAQRPFERWQRPAVAGVGLYLALATLLLGHLPGLAGAAALPGSWLSAFRLDGGLGLLLDPLLALARYETALLLFGIPAVAWTIGQRSRIANVCVYWLAALLLLILLQQGVMGNAQLLLVPGALLVGHFIGQMLTQLEDRLTWLFALGLTLFGALIFVNVARFARVVFYDPQDLLNIWLALFVFAFTAVTIYFFWSWDGVAARQGLVLALLGVTLFYQMGTATYLGQSGANDPRERWVRPPVTGHDLRVLMNTIHEVSLQQTGSPTGLAVVSGVDSPVLRWYLRDFKRLQVGETVPANTNAGIVISHLDETPLFDSDYFGSDFGLLRTGVAADSVVTTVPLLDTLRWWLFHESRAQATQERVVLWIRAGLLRQE